MPLIDFIHRTTWRDLPPDVQNQARRCLLDTLGAAISGRGTRLSAIVHQAAVAMFGGQGALLWLDGRELSPPGAALANGMTIDSVDIHDGHPLTKGHAGAAVVPAALALLPPDAPLPVSGEELLTTLAIGYEVALRAGISLHATACDYHTSGAWNALGVAAMAARRWGLTAAQTRHALGIAEYHGPRSQMMRCIDHPTMVKDGSGWGAMAGLSAALLAQNGFTGAPALTVEADEVWPHWHDLGHRWEMMQQYFKPHAVCRWAQPAVEGAMQLAGRHAIAPSQIRRITVHSFHEAIRLNSRQPATTEEAQYSLPFPVAAALVHGRLSIAQLNEAALQQPELLRLAGLVELVEDPAFNAAFPARRFARVTIHTADGGEYSTEAVEANWDAASPPGDDDLRLKFRALAAEQLSVDRAAAIELTVWHLPDLPNAAELQRLLAASPEPPARLPA
ncbi:MAG: MmgE/PrpD family protein [Anaerolineae bacterium]